KRLTFTKKKPSVMTALFNQ
ncbi:hypothetical protein VCHENC02_4260B, partial [Vibrio harveyi]